MPGQTLARGLDQLVRASSGWGPLIDLYLDGANVTEIAAGFGVSRWFLSQQIRKRARKFCEKVGEDMNALRARGLEERSLHDAETVAPERDAIQKTKLVIEQRHRLAVAADPATWGEKSTGTTVQVISNGQLALVALSTVAKELPAPKPGLPPGGNEEKHDGPEKAA